MTESSLHLTPEQAIDQLDAALDAADASGIEIDLRTGKVETIPSLTQKASFAIAQLDAALDQQQASGIEVDIETGTTRFTKRRKPRTRKSQE